MDRQVITVDIAPGSNAQQRLLVAQGDIGRPLGVRVIQNGLPLNCTGYTAHLYVLKPDHNYYEHTCTISNNNLISWDTAEQETPVSGECLAEIRIMDQDHDIGTATFVEFVESSPADLGYASESLVSSMTEFVDAAHRAAEDATQAVANVDNVNDVAVNASGHIVLSKVLGSTVTSDETVLQPGDIENDLLATTAGKVLDARQGKALKDLVNSTETSLNETIEETEDSLSGLITQTNNRIASLETQVSKFAYGHDVVTVSGQNVNITIPMPSGWTKIRGVYAFPQDNPYVTQSPSYTSFCPYDGSTSVTIVVVPGSLSGQFLYGYIMFGE